MILCQLHVKTPCSITYLRGGGQTYALEPLPCGSERTKKGNVHVERSLDQSQALDKAKRDKHSVGTRLPGNSRNHDITNNAHQTVLEKVGRGHASLHMLAISRTRDALLSPSPSPHPYPEKRKTTNSSPNAHTRPLQRQPPPTPSPVVSPLCEDRPKKRRAPPACRNPQHTPSSSGSRPRLSHRLPVVPALCFRAHRGVSPCCRCRLRSPRPSDCGRRTAPGWRPR